MKTVKEKSNNFWNYIKKHPSFIGCVIDAMRDKAYFKNEKLHREDGPAVEFADGDKRYYINDKKCSYEKWKNEVLKLKLERTLKKINNENS